MEQAAQKEEKQRQEIEQVEEQIKTTNITKTTETVERSFIMKKVMTIEGMMCGHCTGRVQKTLEAIEGVGEVVMSLEDKNATLQLTAEVSDEVLATAVTDAGYDVKSIETL